MSEMSARLACGLVLVVACGTAMAYEESTHRVLSDLAVRKSATYNDPSLFSKLGFPYRDAAAYRSRFSPSNISLTFPGIVADGADWEDNYFSKSGLLATQIPVPPLEFCNHFFNPQANNRSGSGLTDARYVAPLFCGGPGIESPLWALEDRGLAESKLLIGPRQFSMRRAYAALRESLVGFNADTRLTAMSLTLQSLGHIIHHLQDMAQPQHTRNEGHPHDLKFYKGEIAGAYEIYSAEQNTLIPSIVAANSYPSISTSSFATARNFWHTPGSAVPSYVGMAEFSSQNFPTYRRPFVAAGGSILLPPTSVGPDAENPLPGSTNVDGTPIRVVPVPLPTVMTLKGGAQIVGLRYVVVGNVFDGYSGRTHPNRRLGLIGPLGGATEDLSVFDDRHQILLPRAVAFSAAFIDYFFRGRVALAPPTSGDQWTIRNVGSFPLEGRVRIYNESAAGERSSPPFGAVFLVNLQPNAERLVDFRLPSDAKKVIAIFEGKIGSEGDTFVEDSAIDPRFNHVTGDIVDAPPIPFVQLAASTVSIPADGTATSVSVSLSGLPRGTETIVIARQSGSSNISASTNQLMFTTSNYSVPQTVNFFASPNPFAAQSAVFTIGNDNLGFKSLAASQAAAPVTSIPCGTSISYAGSALPSPYLKTMDLGTATGTVAVTFEAYGIPDALEIKRGTSVVSKTNGAVSGEHTPHFQQNAGDGRYVSVKVTPNTDTGTLWTLAVSCPGSSVVPPKPKVNVKFQTESGTIGGWQLSICGSYSYRVNNSISITTYTAGTSYLSITAGTNVLVDVTHDSPNCGSNPINQTSGAGFPTYTDSKGIRTRLRYGPQYVNVQ